MRLHPAIKAIIIVLLIAALGGTYYIYKKRADDIKNQSLNLESQAAQYEKEIKKINDEIEEKRKSYTTLRTTGNFLTGFKCDNVEDFDLIDAVLESYEIKPVIIVDCNDEETLNEMVNHIVSFENEYEVMLTSSPVDIDNVEKAKEMFISKGFENLSGIFFLRNDDNNSTNINQLSNSFVGYTSYSTEVYDGIDKNGMIYFDYSIVSNEALSIEDDRIKSAVDGSNIMLVCFDLSSDELDESKISVSLAVLNERVKAGSMEFSTVAESAMNIRTLNEKVSKEKEEFNSYYAEKQAEIDVLNDKIKALYSGKGE